MPSCSCQIGSLKYTHHFGLNRFATLGEQLILQDSVTQSINPLLPLAFVLGAAALAAGDKLGGTTCFGSQNPPFPLIVARHCSMVTKPQLVPPPLSTAHHLLESAEAASPVKNIDAAVTTTTPERVLRMRVIPMRRHPSELYKYTPKFKFRRLAVLPFSPSSAPSLLA